MDSRQEQWPNSSKAKRLVSNRNGLFQDGEVAGAGEHLCTSARP